MDLSKKAIWRARVSSKSPRSELENHELGGGESLIQFSIMHQGFTLATLKNSQKDEPFSHQLTG